MNEFYLFFYHPKLKDLLLEEIKLKHPELSLSFSNKDFVSMKGPKGHAQSLRDNPIIFSRRQARFLSKEQNRPSSGDFAMLNENQYWTYETIATDVDTFDIHELNIRQEVPARAYHKACQAFRLFDIKLGESDHIIEVGSAPGGISYYVLDQGATLTSIDPAKMDPILNEKFPNRFTHLQKSIFDISKDELPKHCDWVISDLNLDGGINVNQSLRIMDFYKDLKGAFLTIKTPVLSDLEKIEKWVSKFEKKYDVTVCHLPSHRREIGLMIRPLTK